jgi:hypothetical protein
MFDRITQQLQQRLSMTDDEAQLLKVNLKKICIVSPLYLHQLVKVKIYIEKLSTETKIHNQLSELISENHLTSPTHHSHNNDQMESFNLLFYKTIMQYTLHTSSLMHVVISNRYIFGRHTPNTTNRDRLWNLFFLSQIVNLLIKNPTQGYIAYLAVFLHNHYQFMMRRSVKQLIAAALTSEAIPTLLVCLSLKGMYTVQRLNHDFYKIEDSLISMYTHNANFLDQYSDQTGLSLATLNQFKAHTTQSMRHTSLLTITLFVFAAKMILDELLRVYRSVFSQEENQEQHNQPQPQQ